MDAPNIRSALAEHLDAYAEVVTRSSQLWAAEVKRRIVVFIIAAFFTLLTIVVGIFVAILASWNTPYRWWVAGGILVLCVAGILFGFLAAARALRTRTAPPWIVLAEEISTDLRGDIGEPAPIDDDVAMRLQESREQLRGMFSRRDGAPGGGAKVGLGIAGLLLMALLKRKTRSMGGMGLALSLGLAALRAWRRRR